VGTSSTTIITALVQGQVVDEQRRATPALRRFFQDMFSKTAASGANADISSLVGLGGAGVKISAGAGSPETVVTAPVGSLFLRTDGGAGTTLYVKESTSGNTGWVGK
jgi:hypothetical protein